MAHIQFEILLNLQVPKMDSVRTGTYTILHYRGGIGRRGGILSWFLGLWKTWEKGSYWDERGCCHGSQDFGKPGNNLEF